jgi:hypothetical protein
VTAVATAPAPAAAAVPAASVPAPAVPAAAVAAAAAEAAGEWDSALARGEVPGVLMLLNLLLGPRDRLLDLVLATALAPAAPLRSGTDEQERNGAQQCGEDLHRGSFRRRYFVSSRR